MQYYCTLKIYTFSLNKRKSLNQRLNGTVINDSTLINSKVVRPGNKPGQTYLIIRVIL